MSEPIHCPFCGSSDVDKHGWYDGQGQQGPECMGCGATAPSIEAWNRRHTPKGWQTVPAPGTTGEMDDAVRGFLILLSGGAPLTYEDARSHCELYHGPEILESWPDYAMQGSGHVPKAAQADLLYRMMTAAAPRPGSDG
ncbi:hypothetical protein ACGTNG_12820 [Halomonas sp. 1390]|uniref:hypothetical protein n=1 Tax=Halomonas sp. B23F22_3 TaxID=3459516 RepID=UPI00373E1C9A